MLNQKGLAHIFLLLILGFGIIAGVYLVQHPQIFKPKASYSNPIANLTNNLLSAEQEYSNSNQESKEESLKKLEATAIQRKETLVNLIKSDPQSFLDNATLVDRRDEFPEEIKPYIERNFNETGGIETLHSDNFNSLQSGVDYSLLTQDQQFALYFAQNSPAQFITGPNIRIQGVELDNNVVLNSGSEIDNQGNNQQSTSPIRKVRVGVILASFSKMKPEEEQNLAEDPQSISNTIFGDGFSVKNYFLENSNDSLALDGDIIGSYVIDDNTDSCVAIKFNSWAASVEHQIPKATLDQYDTLLYVLPPIKSCNFGGMATMGDVLEKAIEGSRNLVYGIDLFKPRAYILYPHYQSSTYVHELGHNLGVNHSNGLDCGDKPISTHCSSKEYNDKSDVMGYGSSPSFTPFYMDAPHKIALNYISSKNILEIEKSGVYSIKTIDKMFSDSDILVIKIRRPFAMFKFRQDAYYLEYRQQVGFNLDIPGTFTRGALLHIWNGDPQSQTQLVNVNAGLVDINLYPAFFDGKVFTDTDMDLRIEQISHDENEVTLDIQMP